MNAPTEAELEDMLTQLESISESLLGIVDDVNWAHTRLLKFQPHSPTPTPEDSPHG